jgi:hypothetical protein
VYELRGSTAILLTSDVIGREQAITVDFSPLLRQGLQIKPGDPLQLTIQSRESDTFLAVRVVRESPFVNGAEFGAREEFTTKQDSIRAGVGNVPSDDEALAKQHRDRNLRRKDDDDKKRR